MTLGELISKHFADARPMTPEERRITEDFFLSHFKPDSRQRIIETLEAENARLREALAPFAAVRDTVPLYLIPNLPDCDITATLKAEDWQRAKDAYFQ